MPIVLGTFTSSSTKFLDVSHYAQYHAYHRRYETSSTLIGCQGMHDDAHETKERLGKHVDTYSMQPPLKGTLKPKSYFSSIVKYSNLLKDSHRQER